MFSEQEMGRQQSVRSVPSQSAQDILESTGIVTCYEDVLGQMIKEGWPKSKNVYEHVADLVLQWE